MTRFLYYNPVGGTWDYISAIPGPIGPAGLDSTVPGPAGPAGNDGQDGLDGPTGATGPAGPPGPGSTVPGAPGEVWFTGTGAPGTIVAANDGDWYLDALSGDYYDQAAPGAWTLRGNLKGPKGDDGVSTLVVGSFGETMLPPDLPPSGFIPANWDAPGSPSVDTQLTIGQSLYLLGAAAVGHPQEGHLFQYVSTTGDPSGFLDIGLIRGPQGATGVPGADGQDGATGPTGPTGADGATGPAGAPGNAGPPGTPGPPGSVGITGPAGPAGPAGVAGPAGPAGSAPPGGTTDQALVKLSNTDGDVGWAGPHLQLAGGVMLGDVTFADTTNLIMTGGWVTSRAAGYGVEARQLFVINGGTNVTAAEQIRFGYGGQAGGTYRHEIRTSHSGSVIVDNAFEFWVHGSSQAPYSQAVNDAAGNKLMRLAGSQLTAYKNLAFSGTNLGVTFTGGSGIYDWTDKALTLREGTNGSQPRIIDNNGARPRDIIDTLNGDARYINKSGDTMTGILKFNNAISDKLWLYGTAAPALFGMGIKNGEYEHFVSALTNIFTFKGLGPGGTEFGRITQDGFIAQGTDTAVLSGDKYHGWIYNSVSNGEHLRSYQGKWEFRQTNGAVPGTVLGTVDASGYTIGGSGHFQTLADGYGLAMNSGAFVYKRSGGGVTIREHSGGTQPQIEDNNGTNQRDIIDTINGDARYLNSGRTFATNLQGPLGPASVTWNTPAGRYLLTYSASGYHGGAADWWTMSFNVDGGSVDAFGFFFNTSGHTTMPTRMAFRNLAAGNHTFSPSPGQISTDQYDFCGISLIPA